MNKYIPVICMLASLFFPCVVQAQSNTDSVSVPEDIFEVISIEVPEVYGTSDEESQRNDRFTDPRQIFILNGEVVVTMEKPIGDFICISVNISGNNTCMEIKQRGKYYISSSYSKRYRTIDECIEDYMKDRFTSRYDKKVWEAFVEEGGLQRFIEIAKEFIDEEFLTSPFNEIYG